MDSKYDTPKSKRKSISKKKIVHITSFEKTNSEPSQISLGWHIKDIIEIMEDHFKQAAFASLLTVKDVLSIGSVCKTFRKVFNKEYLNLVVRLGNLNSDIRYLFWIHQAPYAKYALMNVY